MRYAWLVPFVTLSVAACASGGGGETPAGTAAGNSGEGGAQEPSGSEPGSFSPDAGTLPGDSDSGPGTGTGTDSSSPTTDSGPGVLPDGGAADTSVADASAPDSGATDSGTDAPPYDGSVVLGESCTAPIDISLGGTFAIDTCALTNSVATTCGTTAAAAILRGVAPMTGSTYSMTFPSGWTLQMLDDTCAPMTYECGSTGTWGVSGATLGGYWYFAVEPTSGTCGTATITVDRVM